MTIFRTTDYILVKDGDQKEALDYFRNAAKECGLYIFETHDDSITMVGYKSDFIKYYIRTMKMSVILGQTVLNEVKRIISVIFWT